MRREQFSFLEISQDPLLTILAIVLLGTVWFVLPDKDRSAPQKIQRPAAPARKTASSLVQLESKIQILKEQIAARQKERGLLQSDLLRGRTSAEQKEENVDPAQMQLSVDKLRSQVEQKQKELADLRVQIQIARRAAEGERDKRDIQAREIARLQNMLKNKQEELDRLKKALDSASVASNSEGFTEMVDSDKKPTFFELVNNQLFFLDSQNYRFESVYFVEGGQRINATRLTRKASAKGESVGNLENAQGPFSKALSGLNPQNERVVFLVHGNSFAILKKARAVTKRRGVEIGWWPFESDQIILTSASHGDKIGSEKR